MNQTGLYLYYKGAIRPISPDRWPLSVKKHDRFIQLSLSACLFIPYDKRDEYNLQEGMLMKDLTLILIEIIVHKALRDTAACPERSIRNLVDLGLHFSSGTSQRDFLKAVQKILQNEKSAYYGLIKDCMATVDHDTLAAFGINIGYYSCTKGAKQIRQEKSQHGIHIPWQLTLAIDADRFPQNREKYRSVIGQGKKLGIYTYPIFAAGRPDAMLSLFYDNPDCAFLLFLTPEQITEAFLREGKPLHNVMISVKAGPNAAPACSALRKERFLYSVHLSYACENGISDRVLSGAAELHPVFTILFAGPLCPAKSQDTVYRYVLHARAEQKYPTLLLEGIRDALSVDEMISGDACAVAFDQNGQMYLLGKTAKKRPANLFRKTLYENLENAAPGPG